MNSTPTQNQGDTRLGMITLPVDTEHGDTPAATHRVYISPTDIIDISGNPIAQELASALSNLLGRYTDQLYSSMHGGLSLEEETVVHDMRYLLARVGMIGPPVTKPVTT